MAELFANSLATTLTAAITNSQTTIAVAVASSFPPTGNFRIQIDTELLLVTAVSGLTLTVTRGTESSATAAHNNGADVTHILTAGALAGLKTNAIANAAWITARNAAGTADVNLARVNASNVAEIGTELRVTYFDPTLYYLATRAAVAGDADVDWALVVKNYMTAERNVLSYDQSAGITHIPSLAVDGALYGRTVLMKAAYPSDELTAGTIGYRPAFGADALCLVGAGTTAGSRNVRLWDDVYIDRDVFIKRNLKLTSGELTLARAGLPAEAAINLGTAGVLYWSGTELDLFGGRLYVDTNIYALGNVSALSFTDRTGGVPDGTDALAEVALVRNDKDGKIDHATLPAFARVTAERPATPTKATEQPTTPTNVTERDLGNMISLLTVAVQQLLARVEALEGRVAT